MNKSWGHFNYRIAFEYDFKFSNSSFSGYCFKSKDYGGFSSERNGLLHLVFTGTFPYVIARRVFNKISSGYSFQSQQSNALVGCFSHKLQMAPPPLQLRTDESVGELPTTTSKK